MRDADALFSPSQTNPTPVRPVPPTGGVAAGAFGPLPPDATAGAGEPAPNPVWIGSGLVEPGDATVSVFDHGLVTGDGVFETVAFRDRRPFALGRHVARLMRSAHGLGLPLPEPALVSRAARAVVAASPAFNGIVRVTWTAGLSPLGSGRVETPPTLVVAAGPLPAHAESELVWVAPWRRNEHGATTGLKTTSYAENVRALAWARGRGADEAIFANTAGRLCEGTGSNIFVVIAGELLTPPLSSGCLAGVTRSLVLERIGGTERDLPIDAIYGAEEVFLTSTTRGVQPVSQVDDRPIPACPGPVTVAARAAFTTLWEEEEEP